jgi:hypothetical protein
MIGLGVGDLFWGDSVRFQMKVCVCAAAGWLKAVVQGGSDVDLVMVMCRPTLGIRPCARGFVGVC